MIFELRAAGPLHVSCHDRTPIAIPFMDFHTRRPRHYTEDYVILTTPAATATQKVISHVIPHACGDRHTESHVIPTAFGLSPTSSSMMRQPSTKPGCADTGEREPKAVDCRRR